MATANIFKRDGNNAIHDGIEHASGGGKTLLDSTDTVFLLLDHQSGLFQNVKDVPVAELRANVTALAKLATLQQIPVITTAEIWATADHAVDGHSHDAHELLYVLRGAIEVNGQTVKENEVAFIPRGTHYSARVLSDQGSHVLRVEFPNDATGNEPPEYDATPWSGHLTARGIKSFPWRR